MNEKSFKQLQDIYYPEDKHATAYSAIKESIDSLKQLLLETKINIHKVITSCVDIMEIAKIAKLPRSAICNSVTKIASLADAYYQDPNYVLLEDIQFDCDSIANCQAV
jgi:ferritin-like metal-binding protein YciE